MSSRKVEPDQTFKCPACGDLQRQPRASQVSHECPVRKRQPTPEKGKRKLSVWVTYERVAEES